MKMPKMPNSLYELLIMVEAMSKEKEENTIFSDVWDEIAVLVGRLSNAISPDIDTFFHGYIGEFYEKITTFLRDPKQITDADEKVRLFHIFKAATHLDENDASIERQVEYQEVQRELLFQKIMGENAIRQFPVIFQENQELKDIFSGDGDFMLPEGIVLPEFLELSMSWRTNLDEMLRQEVVDQELYDYASHQLGYLSCYYEGILRKEQIAPSFETEIVKVEQPIIEKPQEEILQVVDPKVDHLGEIKEHEILEAWPIGSNIKRM